MRAYKPRHLRSLREVYEWYAPTGEPDECWEWERIRLPRGYGRFQFEGKWHYAHRVSYELAYGSVPAGKYVCHRCDNPSCVNPAHLFAGTQSENITDASRKGRAVRGVLNPRAKLTDTEVLRLRDLRASGTTLAELSRAFGVSNATVCAVTTGRTWKHLTLPV